ncbi:hypothetical protein MKK65_29605 [Methylobacterium sp. J-001]|uniref:hypothetical protein n=1 Tax=Methylobacterium sp. J-001 TaxID=2836609 RepID=UPI001FBBF40D|nr:hypothetical protein [Methylobacterium sp. J-001]MCJ2120665.1 hypothetical protein [Methylobacterium sp. J-001]
MSEQKKFLARLETARQEGLVDVKFLFHPSRAVQPEEIFAGLNEIEDAISSGNCVRHFKWNGDAPAEESSYEA